MDTTHLEGRKRAPFEGHVVARAAKTIAGPSRALLAGWNQQIARLRAKSIARGFEVEKEYVTRLRREIAAAHLDFLQARSREGGKTADHSVLRDLDRSYAFLLEQLQALDNVSPDETKP